MSLDFTKEGLETIEFDEEEKNAFKKGWYDAGGFTEIAGEVPKCLWPWDDYGTSRIPVRKGNNAYEFGASFWELHKDALRRQAQDRLGSAASELGNRLSKEDVMGIQDGSEESRWEKIFQAHFSPLEKKTDRSEEV